MAARTKRPAKRTTQRKRTAPRRHSERDRKPALDRLTLWASRKVLDAVRHAAIDHGVSEGAMFEAGARLLLELPSKRRGKLLQRYGAARRRGVRHQRVAGSR